MRIENNILKGGEIDFIESPNHGIKFGENQPDTIVIHFTAGANEQSSVNWLTNEQSKASAHLVVGRGGSIYQLVPFDTIAWHAGRSSYNNRSGFNKYSIGIEIDNAGPLSKTGGVLRAWFGGEYKEEEAVFAVHRNESTPRYWHAYTQKQIELVEDICSILIANYPIKQILGHEEIAPQRKNDPGPAFPLDKLRDRLLGEGRDNEDPIETNIEQKGVVLSDKLNIRSGPGVNNNAIAEPLTNGQEVEIVEISGDWLKINTNLTGWVHKNYIKII